MRRGELTAVDYDGWNWQLLRSAERYGFRFSCSFPYRHKMIPLIEVLANRWFQDREDSLGELLSGLPIPERASLVINARKDMTGISALDRGKVDRKNFAVRSARQL